MYSSVDFISSFCQAIHPLSVIAFNLTLFIGVPVIFTILFAVYKNKMGKADEKRIKVKEEFVFYSAIILVWLSSFVQYETVLLGF